MAISSFRFPTDIRFGEGASKLLANLLKDRKKQRPLIVTDHGLKDSSLVSEIVSDLKSAGLVPAVFAETGGNPLESHVKAGLACYRQAKADSLVLLGGGCPIDVGKAIALMVNHPGELFDYEDDKVGARPMDQEIPLMIAVPTTSGTGSEVGGSTVISYDSDHKKVIVWGTPLLPKIVLADPLLTFALPPHLTAQTGMDALTHNVEAFLAKNFHPICEGIAFEGVRLVAASLPTAVSEPQNLQARRDMMMASIMGAVAFQKGLGVTHSLAHSLSTCHDLHHGLANALCIEACMRFNGPGFSDKFSRLMLAVGAKEDSTAQDRGFADWLAGFLKQVGISKSLRDYNVTLSERLVEVAFKDPCHQNNPKPVRKDDIEKLFRAAIGG